MFLIHSDGIETLPFTEPTAPPFAFAAVPPETITPPLAEAAVPPLAEAAVFPLITTVPPEADEPDGHPPLTV